MGALECAATNKRGDPCGFAARRETGLCINHDPAYREQQRENLLKGVRNSLRSRYETPYALQLKDFDLSDRASILALVEAALALEFAGQLPSNRCRNIIRLLSIATRNLPNSAELWSRTTAEHQQWRYQAVRTNLGRLQLALLGPDADTEDTP